MHNKWGYTGALWCAFYSLGMVPIVDTSQPNNPNFDDWYKHLLCPWNFPAECGGSDRELNGNEQAGVKVCPWKGHRACAPNQHPQYPIFPDDIYVKDEPDRRTMSCALCGRLARTFPGGAPVGAPDKIEAAIGTKYSFEGISDDEKPNFDAWWDFHAFGAWMANRAAKAGHRPPWGEDVIVNNINVWRASNGEEIHGHLWQRLRLAAYDTGTLEGTRLPVLDPDGIAVNAFQVCKSFWWHAPQSRDDCSHAAGHGFFYYFMDIGPAILACTSDQIVNFTPGPSEDTDSYTRMGCAAARTAWLRQMRLPGAPLLASRRTHPIPPAPRPRSTPAPKIRAGQPAPADPRRAFTSPQIAECC